MSHQVTHIHGPWIPPFGTFFYSDFCLISLKAWLEIVYSSLNSITANLLELSDDLFIFNSHPADMEKL